MMFRPRWQLAGPRGTGAIMARRRAVPRGGCDATACANCGGQCMSVELQETGKIVTRCVSPSSGKVLSACHDIQARPRPEPNPQAQLARMHLAAPRPAPLAGVFKCPPGATKKCTATPVGYECVCEVCWSGQPNCISWMACDSRKERCPNPGPGPQKKPPPGEVMYGQAEFGRPGQPRRGFGRMYNPNWWLIGGGIAAGVAALGTAAWYCRPHVIAIDQVSLGGQNVYQTIYYKGCFAQLPYEVIVSTSDPRGEHIPSMGGVLVRQSFRSLKEARAAMTEEEPKEQNPCC